MSENYNEDDIELQNAIGDVFKNIDIYDLDNKQQENEDFDQLQANVSHSQDEFKQLHQSHHSQDIHPGHSFDGDIELRNDGNTHEDGELNKSEHQQEDINDDDLDINFDDAISDAFKSLQKEDIRRDSDENNEIEHTEDSEVPNVTDNKNSNDNDNDQQMMEFENNEEDTNNNQDEEDGDDLDLANAISSALKSIDTIRHEDTSGVGESTESNNNNDQDELNDQQLHQKQSEYSGESKGEYSPLEVEKHQDNDNDVEEEEEDDDFDLENAIGNAFDSIKKSGDLAGNDVQNANGPDKHEENYSNDNRQQQTISEDMLQELAKEITSKVSEIDGDKEKNKHLQPPKIDDQVLNHFVNEAHGRRDDQMSDDEEEEDEDFDDSKLQSTIENAVKSVISNQESKDDDLNNLQMNDILTNAFNMAMENPTELLNNLETDQIRNKDELFDSPELTRRLSIFDSLGSRRPVDLNSQLSSMMLNLSKNNDSNLLTVIKSLTNFLTNSNFQIFKNSLSLISVINQYRHNSFEKLFVNSLNLSKNYLRSNSKLKCIVAIDNILILFGKSTTGDILNYNYNLVTLITNSIINCITSFSNLKNFKNSIFKKPKLTNLEYKEKIRIENRQRKKKWREENSERNKDNDLRARVLKRANSMFGLKESLEKLNWIEEEFNRRRERRLLKQKKETANNALNGNPSKEISNEQLVNDKNLIQLVNDFFNIFSNFAPKDDPETGLFTTSVNISCVSIIYLLSFSPSFEFKKIDSIVTSIINNMLNTFNTIDQQERLIYLARGSDIKLDNLKSIYSDEISYEVDPRLGTNLNSLSGLSSDLPDIGDSQDVIMKSGEEQLLKRQKLDSIEPGKPAINLKFPSYKNEDKKTNIMPISSSSNSGLQMNLKNLKKPGTFKRPSYGDKKGKSLGFPPFYSTSIRQ